MPPMKEQLTSIHALAEALGHLLRDRSSFVSAAESCTGGSLCAAITDIPGCSAWFDRGFITYSNESKETLLSVPNATLLTHGAVSEATARAMAEGALNRSKANVSVAITGVAGPGGGSVDTPVGTVFIACAGANQQTIAKGYLFQGNRPAIRHQAVFAALQHLMKRLA